MNGELRLNLPMITDNDKFFQKHYITRTLFIIIQIIGKTKRWKNTNLRDSAFKTQPCVKDKNRDVLSYFFR